MKLPKPVAYLHVPLVTWGGKIRPVPSLLKYNEPDIYGEVINLYGENQLREALARQEIVMRMALDALLTVANPKALAAIKALKRSLNKEE